MKCTIWNSSADPDYPPDPADRASESATRTPPSTRAGGQDDGSQTNSLKLRISIDRDRGSGSWLSGSWDRGVMDRGDLLLKRKEIIL